MNRRDCYVSFVEAKSTTETFTLDKAKTHVVEGHGNVQLQITSNVEELYYDKGNDQVYVQAYSLHSQSKWKFVF
jgi:hypothetical protein